MRRLILLTAAMTLAACAGARAPERLAADDIADCRRHAEQGPGGPSRMVGTSLGVNPAASRRSANIAAAAMMTARDRDGDRVVASTQEAIYWDCMRARGYSLPEPDGTVRPERVGLLPGLFTRPPG